MSSIMEIFFIQLNIKILCKANKKFFMFIRQLLMSQILFNI
jgi:hypothetical protein